MKIENLEKGNEIQKRLSHLKEQKEKYEKSTSFLHSERTDFSDGYHRVNNIDLQYIDFNVMKTLALKEIENLISKYEKEFEEL